MITHPGQRFLRIAAEARARVREVTPRDAAEAVRSGALFLDVRERGEFARRRARGAVHLSKGPLELRIESYAPDPGAPIICSCDGGNRAALAAESLQRMGYSNVRSVGGGLQGWINAGLPTVSDREFLD